MTPGPRSTTQSTHTFAPTFPYTPAPPSESGGPVLELGVGTGRVAVPTVELGIDVVGVDNSEAMLSVASRKAAALSDAMPAASS